MFKPASPNKKGKAKVSDDVVITNLPVKFLTLLFQNLAHCNKGTISFQESLDREEVGQFVDLHKDVEFRKSLSRGSVDPPFSLSRDSADPPLAIVVKSSSSGGSPTKELCEIEPAVRQTVSQLIDYATLMREPTVEHEGQEEPSGADGRKSPIFPSPIKHTQERPVQSQTNQPPSPSPTEVFYCIFKCD